MSRRPPQTADALRDWLRQLKHESGASFPDIARAIGEDERTVKRWMPEAGRPVTPSGDTLLRLLDYFGVTLDPPTPRKIALSLMGEIRDVRETLHRLERGQNGDGPVTLPEIDHRLESLTDEVEELVRLLTPNEARRRPPGASTARENNSSH